MTYQPPTATAIMLIPVLLCLAGRRRMPGELGTENRNKKLGRKDRGDYAASHHRPSCININMHINYRRKKVKKQKNILKALTKF